MATQHVVTSYTFDELSESAQDRAAEEISDFLIQDADMDWLVDQWAEDLAASGITVDQKKTYWSVGWSQSDGATFDADVDLPAWMKSQKLAGKYRTLYNLAVEGYVRANIVGATGHSLSAPSANLCVGCPGDMSGAACERADAQSLDVEALLGEWASDAAHRLYRELRDELESYRDREYVRDFCDGNDYQFYADGSMYH